MLIVIFDGLQIITLLYLKSSFVILHPLEIFWDFSIRATKDMKTARSGGASPELLFAEPITWGDEIHPCKRIKAR